MEQVKIQRTKKKKESPTNLNLGITVSVAVYISFLAMSLYNNQFFMDKLLIVGAILSFTLLFKILNTTNN